MGWAKKDVISNVQKKRNYSRFYGLNNPHLKFQFWANEKSPILKNSLPNKLHWPFSFNHYPKSINDFRFFWLEASFISFQLFYKPTIYSYWNYHFKIQIRTQGVYYAFFIYWAFLNFLAAESKPAFFL